MQSHLLAWLDGFGANPGLTAGVTLVAAVGLQTVVALIIGARRLHHQQRQFRLEQERLALVIRTARIRSQAAEAEKASWNGWRKFAVARKIAECEDVYSFELRPHDGKAIPGFKPGQYLTFGLDLPGRDKQVVRCYSLSDAPQRRDCYRVTIKRDAKPGHPPGVASSHFCDGVNEGDILNVKAPAGHFALEAEKESPVVLIGAGVGITPVLAMAKAVAAAGSQRETWFFFVCRNRSDFMLKSDVEALSKVVNLKVHICYSRPGEGDVQGRDYQHEGRLTPELIKSLLPSANYDFYLCGNGAFMADMFSGLIAWGVPEAKIHFEAFGPATIKKTSDTVALSKKAIRDTSKVRCTVTFAKSGRMVQWEPGAANLLEFAQSHGVRINCGCCAGSCGSCLVAVKSGEVAYINPPATDPEAGSCLTCVCRPKGDLVLDA
jgi:ferredoxin-NADP reductase